MSWKNCNIIYSKYDYTTTQWYVYDNVKGTENIIHNKIIYNILYSGCEINMKEASGNFPSSDYNNTYMDKHGIIQYQNDRTQSQSLAPIIKRDADRTLTHSLLTPMESVDSEGGLIQLVAYGVQDVNLGVNPQIKFWKVTYRQTRNFHIDSIQ